MIKVVCKKNLESSQFSIIKVAFNIPNADSVGVIQVFKDFFLKIILSELVPADGASSDPHSIGAKTIRGRTALAAD